MKKKNQLIKVICIFLTTLIIVFSTNIFSPIYSLDTPEKTENFPVVLDDDTLFMIQNPTGSISAEERADIINRRLNKLANDDSLEINDDDFDLDDKGNIIVLLYKGKTLTTITEDDAKSAYESRQKLAEERLKIIQKAIKRYRRERQPFYWVLGIIFTIVTFLILLLTLKIFDVIFPYFYSLLDSWQGTLIPSIRIQNLELLSAERLTKIFKKIVKVIRISLTFFILYAFLPVVLGFFPQTRQVGRILFDYLLRAINLVSTALVGYLPNIFIVSIIIYLTYYSLRFLKWIFGEIETGNISFIGFYSEWAQPTYRILTWLTIALAAVFAFPYLPGFNSPAFQGVSAFLALLFTLGSTGVVSNTVSGFVLIYTRAFQVSDRVKIGDAVGDVLDKTLLVTRIRTIKNVVITIPNSVIMNSNVINFSALARDLQRPLILHTTITLGYDIPWRHVHQTLIAAAQASNYILKEPPPFVLQTALNDFYISYEINAYTNESTKMAEIYSELHQNIQDKCAEGDIEILSPHYAALRDGNHNTIPADYLPENYTAPGFKIDPITNILNQNYDQNHSNH
ncbi:mechanosensitive ion channel family protein [Crocosphaera sp. UHCC 0190]|uniref:mechanosensitive ion channel family protein n=1 Tax=Crocosphaera sp. UHCC 0190 TaxID=3110246 RepID=UPI002B20749C|nr:mechanosensitive ion channel family protein [Crocosphaera sp. UHCC 0190]MEA5509296.1 mechanosensitive ion channel family protein [Crocosphaera sp. UHCC 0190]